MHLSPSTRFQASRPTLRTLVHHEYGHIKYRVHAQGITLFGVYHFVRSLNLKQVQVSTMKYHLPDYALSPPQKRNHYEDAVQNVPFRILVWDL